MQSKARPKVSRGAVSFRLASERPAGLFLLTPSETRRILAARTQKRRDRVYLAAVTGAAFFLLLAA